MEEENSTDELLPISTTAISEEESLRLFKDFEERLISYVYGVRRHHPDDDDDDDEDASSQDTLDDSGPDSFEAFWEDARKRLLQHHLEMLQTLTAKMLRDLGGGDRVDAIIDDMDRALAEGRRTLSDHLQ